MPIRVIDHTEVRRLLPMAECIELMQEALIGLSDGRAVQPLRTVMWLPDRRGAVGLMPAATLDPPSLAVKLVTIFPENHGKDLDSHQGAVLLFDSEQGSPLAVIEAGALTAIRTAAVSAVATRALAREDAGDLALLGSGVQAREHLEALSKVRDLRRVRVWSPTRTHREAFASREGALYPFPVESCEDAESAVRDADLICTVSFSSDPILKGEWVSPGAHINAVGSSIPQARELDTAAVMAASLFIDRYESTLNEAGDFLTPKREGAVDDSHIRAEIGDVLAGKAVGRRRMEEVTLFKSLGLGIEDAAAARWIYRRAQEKNVGVSVPFGGPLDPSD